MTNVPMSMAKDKLCEYAAAAAAGEEVVVTRHGKPYVKIVKADDDRLDRQRAALASLKAYRRRVPFDPVAIDDIVTWVREDRD